MLFVAILSERIAIVASIRWNLIIRPPVRIVISAAIVPSLALFPPILGDDGVRIEVWQGSSPWALVAPIPTVAADLGGSRRVPRSLQGALRPAKSHNPKNRRGARIAVPG